MSEIKGLQRVSSPDAPIETIDEILNKDPSYIDRGLDNLGFSVYSEVLEEESLIRRLQYKATVGARAVVATEVAVVGIALDGQRKIFELFGIHVPEI